MKALFLDHDGVICLSNNWGSRFKKQKKADFEMGFENTMPFEVKFDNFDKKAINVLNSIIHKTDCEIVVSSDWRSHCSLSEMGDYYESQGIAKRPIDMIPFFKNLDLKEFNLSSFNRLEQERHFEILDWLSKNSVSKWVAVDDLDMSLNGSWGLSNFVLTPLSNEGIKQTGIYDKIIKFLL